MKKAQINYFVLIGILLIVATIIFGAYNYSHTKELKNEIYNLHGLSNIDHVKIYIDNCLEQASLQAIADHGILDSEERLEEQIDREVSLCVNNFEFFKEFGYIIDAEAPKSEIKQNNEMIIVILNYMISFEHEDKRTRLSEFTYEFYKDAYVKVDKSVIKEGKRIVSGDNKAVMEFNYDTNVYNEYTGDEVEYVRLSILDDNANGLSNSVVIGSLIYEGFPDGAVFDPPIDMSITISEKDLVGVNPETLRISYLDNGIWHAYSGSKFDQDSMTVKGKISHFSPIAVSICGGEDNEITLSMDTVLNDVFKDDGEQCNPDRWTHNFKNSKKNSLGFHILPEYMKIFECGYSDPNQKVYLAGSEFDLTFCKDNDEYIQDWDMDDDLNYEIDPENVNPMTERNLQELNELMELEGFSETQKSDNLNKVFEGLRPICIRACKLKAVDELKKTLGEEILISGDGIRDGATLYCSGSLSAYTSSSYKELTKSIRLNDIYLGCNLDDEYNNLKNRKPITFNNYPSKTFTMEWYDEDDFENPEREGFFASPKTFGFNYIPTNSIYDFQQDNQISYEDIENEKEFNYIEYGGEGHYTFNLNSGGDACVDSAQTISPDTVVAKLTKKNIDLLSDRKVDFPIASQEGEQPLILPVLSELTTENNLLIERILNSPWSEMTYNLDFLEKEWDGTCSDECIWTINKLPGEISDKSNNIIENTEATPGKLREGSNTITVRVNNLNDPCLYAKADIKLIGKGIQKKIPNNYFECENPDGADSCWLTSKKKPEEYPTDGYCVLKDEWDPKSKLCCFGRNSGQRVIYADKSHLEQFPDDKCMLDPNARPNNKGKCELKNGIWFNPKCIMHHEYESGYCVYAPYEEPNEYSWSVLIKLEESSCPCSEDDLTKECLPALECKLEITKNSKKCGVNDEEGVNDKHLYCCEPK